MSPIELGKFIANLRNEKNLTQEELAEKLFIDKRKISRWECGTSIPEFEMLIKLSEILDVSLYELSIYRRIENEYLPRRVINEFKSLKDFKKYKTIKKIKIIILIIIFILFIITAAFTIKHNNTIKIYKMHSLDDNYYFEGDFINTKEFNLFYIKSFNNKKDEKEDIINSMNCEYEVYDQDKRIFQVINDNRKQANLYKPRPYNEIRKSIDIKDTFSLQIKCSDKNNKLDTYKFDIKLTEIYDNNLF